PINISWGAGEKVKEIKISALSDYIIEKNPESFSLKLTNASNVTTDNGLVNIETTIVNIIDKTTKSFAVYNLQKIVRNILPLINTTDFFEDLSNATGYNMNIYVAKDGAGPNSTVNSNYRFFPNNNLKLTIKNEVTDTSLPIIPVFTTSD